MPERVEVDAGTSVVWDNRDAAPHTATAADEKTFDTKVLKKAQKSRAVTFDKPGEYAYICDLHPFMKGTVVVK